LCRLGAVVALVRGARSRRACRELLPCGHGPRTRGGSVVQGGGSGNSWRDRKCRVGEGGPAIIRAVPRSPPVRTAGGPGAPAAISSCWTPSVPETLAGPPVRPILVFDFGSQYVQLIARRVRERHALALIVRHDLSPERVRELDPLALIFSGGPAS